MAVRGNRAWLFLAAFACSAAAAQPAQAPSSASSARQMTEAARALLAALDADERSHWSNVPYRSHPRPGLRLGDLDREAMLRVHDLLRASLSSQGYQKAAGIVRLDDINRAQQVARLAPNATAFQRETAESFGSANYFVLFFGDPRREERWGWLLQGHHLAMSFTVADGKTAFLPMFAGATPLAVAEETETGWSALAQEVTRGVELMTALTESQRKIAISPAEVPGDVLNGVGNKGRFTPIEGLRAADMTAEQRRLLRALVEPFYYRVQGPRISIELRNTADHVHTVTRDPANDYGEAWLGFAYRETITAEQRSAAARAAE
jgi:hypothetical protein